MKQSRTTRGLIAGATALALVTLVVACGDGDNDPSSSGSPATPVPDGGTEPEGTDSGTGGGGDSGYLGVEASEPACGATSGGSIVVALSEDLPTLDPTQNFSFGTSAVALYPVIYDRFFRTSPDLQDIEPQLATSAEPNEDFTEWTIKLRDDVVFQDGTPFTSADAVFSLQYTLDGINGYAFGPMSGIAAVDEHTVVATFDSPYANFVRQGLASPVSGYVIRDDFGGRSAEDYFQAPLTTAAYAVSAYNASTGLTLEANTQYWSGKGPYLDSIEVRFISDTLQRSVGLEGGEFAYVDFLTAPLLGSLGDSAQGRVLPSTSADTIVTRRQEGILSDQNVRQAIQLALNRQQIADNLYAGFAQPAGTYLPVLPGVRPVDGGQYDFDLDRARQLMAQSDYPEGGSFELLIVAGNPSLEQEATYIQAQLAEIGIDVMVSPVGAAEMDERRQTDNLDATLFFNSALSTDAIDFVSAGLSPPPFGWSGVIPLDVFEKVNSGLQATTDPAEIESLLTELSTFMADQAVSIPVVNAEVLLAQSADLQNLDVSALNEPYFQEAWLCGN